MPQQRSVPLLTLRSVAGLYAFHDRELAAAALPRPGGELQDERTLLFGRVGADCNKYLDCILRHVTLRGKARGSLGTALRAEKTRKAFELDPEFLVVLEHAAKAADAVRHLTPAVLEAAHGKLETLLGSAAPLVPTVEKGCEVEKKKKKKKPRRPRWSHDAGMESLDDEWADGGAPLVRSSATSTSLALASSRTTSARVLDRHPSDEAGQPAHKKSARDPLVMELTAGQVVVIGTLEARPELLGTTAKIVAFVADSKRWRVVLPSGERLCLRPEVIRPSIFGSSLPT